MREGFELTQVHVTSRRGTSLPRRVESSNAAQAIHAACAAHVSRKPKPDQSLHAHQLQGASGLAKLLAGAFHHTGNAFGESNGDSSGKEVSGRADCPRCGATREPFPHPIFISELCTVVRSH